MVGCGMRAGAEDDSVESGASIIELGFEVGRERPEEIVLKEDGNDGWEPDKIPPYREGGPCDGGDG